MAARLPLRTLLRDVLMMLCGSFLGLLLAQSFVSHSLRVSDASEICDAIQMTKRAAEERSKVVATPPLMKSGGGGSGGSSWE